MYKVSVIVPIFKVEQFIRNCALNLFEQTLSDVQYIFVDDCTPDASIAVLEEVISHYPARKDAIKICTHTHNKGLPAARNTGLNHASGEFIFHCDSDDWLEQDALELLYNKTIADHADIVWCDWYLSFKDNERYMSQSALDNRVLTGEEVTKLMLSGRLKYNVWNKLVRRKLYTDNQIYFPEGYGMGEDMTMIKLFGFTNRVSYLPQALYHYVQLNTEAFTKKTSAEHLEQIKYNVTNVVNFLEERYGNSIIDYIYFFKLNVKFPFLISLEKVSYDRWNAWYPEANPYIDKNVLFNWRTRLLQKMALRHQYWVLRIHYICVIRVVYGLFYK